MGKKSQQKSSLSHLVDDLLKACSCLKVNDNPIIDLQEFSQLMPTIDNILLLEKDKAKFWLHDRKEWIEKLSDWALLNGISMENVEIKYCDTYGYGIYATKSFAKNEELLKIPRNMIFTHENLPHSDLDKLAGSDPLLSKMPQTIIALKLMAEGLNPESKWYNYIMSLPTEFSIPLYMNFNELDSMKRSPSLVNAVMQCRNITRVYAYIYKLLECQQRYPGLHNFQKYFCLSAFRWAMASVITRQNMIPDKTGENDVICLIPIWDMCNHEEGVITTTYCSESNQTICKTHRGYEMGDQVFIYYGNRSNGEFLVNNGFVYLSNKHDVIEVKLGLSKNDPHYSLKLSLTNKLSLPTSGNYKFYNETKFLDRSLVAFLRINCMDKESLMTWGVRKDPEVLLEAPISKDDPLDKKVIEYLTVRLNLLIKSYPTSPEETALSICPGKYSPQYRSHLPILLKQTEQNILAGVISYLASL